MTNNDAIPFSVLDLSPIVQGGTVSEALHNTRELALQVERLGYHRFWLAEHHNMTGIASAATAIVIEHVAAGTSTIRVGSGGVMLPNHAPLVIAEQFGTLESLHPGRIDLGLGRAPGTDQATARALRRERMNGAESFPDDVRELQSYFLPPGPDQKITAVPGAGLRVPIWLLGSSLFSAQLAAFLGLPFSFASHFAPDHLLAALEIYRRQFRPSESLERPYAMAAINVFAAETEEEAKVLSTSLQQQFVNLQRGTPGPFPPPVRSMDGHWSPMEKEGVARSLRESVTGSPTMVRAGLEDFIERTQVDELMVTSPMFDPAARLHSFEIVAEVCAGLMSGGK